MFVMEAAVKELKLDKDNLVRENAELREKNLNFALITSDLNSKVKELEHERDSLVTAMRLQQQEFEQGHYEPEDGQKWKTVSGVKQSKEDQATMNFELNRYDVLNDEANTQNSDLHASVIEINSETQQPSTGQNTAVDNNISPEKGDNASNCTELTHDKIQGNKGNSSRATEQTPVKVRVPTQGIVIIGDSIIKNVNPVKLSKRRVQKYTYPGKTTPEINNELTKINIQLPPSHVIVHTGTNDVPVETTEKCVSNMEELIMSVKQKFPNSKIGISGITPRQDIDLKLKIKEIDEKVQTLSSKHGVKFINNLSIDKTCLNSSKLHLNAKGSAILASHFIKFLRDGQSLSLLHPIFHLDILAINESKIDNQISNDEIHIHGFNIIRKDRNRFGGGVVLYVRDTISFSDRKDIIPDGLEMVCIELNLPYNKSLLISTWYRPPNSHMNIFDYWAGFLSKCDNEDKELILIGDLNCNVSKNVPHAHTCKLQFLCSLYQIDQLIKECTRLTPTSATLIDLILTNTPENISRSGGIHLGISDHSLVYAVSSGGSSVSQNKLPQLILGYIYILKYLQSNFIG